MQIVGIACDACGVTVTVERGAAGCAKCERVYHARCTEEEDRCDACGGSMAGFTRATTASEVVAEARFASEVRRGRLLLLVCGGIHVALDGLFAALNVMSEHAADGDMRLPAVFNAILSGSLLYAAVGGRQWARVVLGGLALLSGGLLVWISSRNALFTVVGALRIISGGMLLWSGDVREFVEARRLRR